MILLFFVVVFCCCLLFVAYCLLMQIYIKKQYVVQIVQEIVVFVVF